MRLPTLLIVAVDGIGLHKQTLLPPLVYCPSGSSADRDNIAAWPAAVAANRDLFLSASVEKLSTRTRSRVPASPHQLLSPVQSLGQSPQSQ